MVHAISQNGSQTTICANVQNPLHEAKPKRGVRADGKASVALRQQRAAVCAVLEQFMHHEDAKDPEKVMEYLSPVI